MLSRDIFARSIEHPKDFSNDVLDQEQFFQFSVSEVRKGDYALSVASRWLLRNLAGVHEYGRFVVDCKNARFRQSNGTDPNPMKKYVGSYNLFAGSIENLSLRHYQVGLRWKPEEGQDAHFEIELTHKGNGTKKELKKDRREARSALFDARFGPDICENAADDSDLSGLVSQLKRISMPV